MLSKLLVIYSYSIKRLFSLCESAGCTKCMCWWQVEKKVMSVAICWKDHGRKAIETYLAIMKTGN